MTSAFVAVLHTPIVDGIANTKVSAEWQRAGRAFLVEPARSTTDVIKISGTLTSQKASDATSAAVVAFAHYAAQLTACSKVFTDLQGTSQHNLKNLYADH